MKLKLKHSLAILFCGLMLSAQAQRGGGYTPPSIGTNGSSFGGGSSNGSSFGGGSDAGRPVFNSGNNSSNTSSNSGNNNSSSNFPFGGNDDNSNTPTYNSSYYGSPYQYNENNVRTNYSNNVAETSNQQTSSPQTQNVAYDLQELERMEQAWRWMSDKTMQTSAKSGFKPAFEGVDVPFYSFKFDAAKGTKISLDNGTSINVPKNAFVDKDGKTIAGEVELNYREFHNAADIIASGIPMHDPATGQYMETAGMFEMKGNQGGDDISIAPGKDIEVKMASYNQDGNFDFWQYDATKGAWSEQDGGGQVAAQRLGRNGAKGDANPTPTNRPRAEIVRPFNIGLFGLHNWDMLRGQTRSRAPQREIIPVFDENADIADRSLNTIPFFWVTREGRSVIQLQNTELHRVMFTPYCSDALVALLPDNKVAVFNGADFGRLSVGGIEVSKYPFKTAEKPISSISQLSEILKLE